ncbi:hypothetical protein ACFSMW_19790 [Virgibacillus halophilus]|uniref:YjzC-like protein n=1 Tax=Tigheibacillus halophilus TaxID=361280 RepID=A0ABU5CAN2_9BACI|nr:hypothetical protein [Virgibacillus halophilus]
MEKKERVYRTGQGIPVSGEYICQSGVRKTFKEDGLFPVCPTSGKETHWEHHDHS